MGQRMAQGAYVRTPLMTVLEHDMAGDVNSALNLFQLGIHPPREINSKGLLKPLSLVSRF